MVQRQHLHVLDENSAVPVHDRLRQSCRTRGVQQVQRVVEGHLLEGERLFGVGRQGAPRKLFDFSTQIAKSDYGGQ
jgi:hypothetical protein